MFCQNCGAEINDNAVVCVKCGCAVVKKEQAQLETKVSNNLALAIFSTICCCIPTGIVSIIYATKVDGLLKSGDVSGAKDAAKKASMCAWIGTISGAIFGVIYILLAIIGEAANNMQ